MRPPRVRGTVRFRVTALAVVVVGLALGVASGLLVVSLRAADLGALDSTLRVRAAGVTGQIDRGSLTLGEGEDRFEQVVDADGLVVAASTNLTGEGPVAGPVSAATFRDLEVAAVDDGVFRVLSVASDGLTLHVGDSREDVDERIARLVAALSIGVPLLMGLIGVVVWWLVGRTLLPVERIRSEVLEIESGDLHRRVPVPQSSDEIARLATAMNQMLDRLQQASDRERLFVADAAHELRSPLTRMRSELEVDLAHPETADLKATHHSVLEEAIGLQQLAQDLLLLARGGSPPMERVDLGRLAAERARRLSSDIEVRAEPALIAGDARQIARLIDNLLTNARRHAAGEVVISTRVGEGVVRLIVSDDGPGVPAEQRERIFDRFTRLDEARSADEGGSGLGLAIVRSIAAGHGASVWVEDAEPGARFVVEFPEPTYSS